MNNYIRSSLIKVMEEYLTAKTEPFKDHALAAFVRQEIPKKFYQISSIDYSQYNVRASVGQGVWTHVPWIALLNKNVTNSTQRGYYIVYLFSEDMRKVYVTIAQGVTETSREEMVEINKEIRKLVKSRNNIQSDGKIYLGDSPRAKEYALSTAIYIKYTFDNMPSEEVLQEDLKEMIQIYEKYIEKNREVPTGIQFVQEVVKALEKQGGQATLNEIYEAFEEENESMLATYTDWKAQIRRQIYLHSSDADIFRGEVGDEKDLFYAVKGKGKGVWGLRNISTHFPIQDIVTEKENEYNITPHDLPTHIHNYIKSKGFIFSLEEVTNLYLSLRTKPFVILSGISGTGKTKMAQWFAESIGATEENGQFSLIPVRPDWSDGSDLLGYIDIKGEFKEGPLTTIIKRAIHNPRKPYFVLLDEMNLARVEYYFSDILSVMESKKWENGEIVSSPLLTEENAGFTMSLPNNIYIIGTVNMDETTHPFSKKVLDRANTIEFNRVNLENLSFLGELEEMDPLPIFLTPIESTYLHLKDAYVDHQYIIEQVTEELIKMNAVLEVMHAHVGYRVRDEICFYLAYNEENNLLTFNNALDYCVLQKILPRISGSDSRVDWLLKELFLLFTNIAFDETFLDVTPNLEAAKYPKSALKVLEMLRRLEDGFTSFWIT